MIARTIKIAAGAFVLLFSSGAFADCNDIKVACARAYELDAAACERNYSGQQQSACHARAARQSVYCVQNAGCR
ncbi:hypothetical protein NLM16_27860 [Bradyrhizobium brasilense]|uniref:hypothetical protein n=1 Tax=Bradyrhizobium brasilense TaxID=1419277 RepID=UPI002877B23F|nr:hypothetical protein [Bradyrhizobium brasilense]MCP3417928.1 hypothetical protein [Bradyrhizobium brasilense]